MKSVISIGATYRTLDAWRNRDIMRKLADAWRPGEDSDVAVDIVDMLFIICHSSIVKIKTESTLVYLFSHPDQITFNN